MKKILWGSVAACAALVCSIAAVRAQEKPTAAPAATPGAARVFLVVTNEAQRGADVPTLQSQDVKVKMGRDFVKVNELVPARDNSADMQLLILIDDTLDPGLIGSYLNDLRDFINAQPKTTAIAVAYMSNTTIQIAQNFSPDHDAAAKALRLPRGALSAMDSPYLSVVSLAKGWPQQKIRREVLLVADGIDRLRGTGGGGGGGFRGGFGGPGMGGPGMGAQTRPYHSIDMSTISADVDQASEAAQKTGIIVYSIFARGVGRMARSMWDAETGLSGLTKLSEETGGECFSIGTQNPVSFKPYLDQLQRLLNNQYYVVFQATQSKKSELRSVKISTEVPNSEIVHADNVWVPAPAK